MADLAFDVTESRAIAKAQAPAILRRRSSSAFDRHGIDHLSPSSLNTWIASPSLWVMERLIGRRGPAACAMHRGTAVEAGVAYALFNPAARVSDCAIHALARYDELSAASGDPKREQERGVVAGMIAQAIDYLRPLGPPDAPPEGWNQHRIEIELEDVAVPIIGFLDFEWPGRIKDLKTTMRVPSTMSDAHKRQGAVYRHARGNSEVGFVYCSDKKSAELTLEPEDARQALHELRHSAIRLGRFLSLSADAYELASIIQPDFSTYHWSDEQTRALGRVTYGF